MPNKTLFAGPLARNQIQLVKRSESLRQTNDDIESLIAQKWQEKQRNSEQKGLLLYNGRSFRLEQLVPTDSGVVLEVTEFEYRIRGTLEMIPDSTWLYGEQYVGRGLAIGALLKTTDNYYIIGQRSGKTQETSTYDFIGGIVDADIAVSEEGLWNMLIQEMAEEAHLSKDDIDSGFYLGVFQSHSGNCMITASINLARSKEECIAIFAHADKQELSDLVYISADKIIEFLYELGGYKRCIADLLSTNPKLLSVDPFLKA